MIFQALAPSTEVFAQELDAVMEASVSAARAAGNTARSVQDAVATALQDADQATSDDVATTPGADAGATEGGDGSTNAGESQDSTTDGTTNGDTPTEGDASQDDAAADEGAADGEQADDADADAADQANTAPTIATVEDLRHALGDGNVITDDLGAVTAVTFESNADLIAISNTDPAIYQNANISKGGSTGIDFDVCGAEIVDGLGSLTFQGFGSDAYPFKGALNLGDRTLTVNKTVFNNIELSDANSTVKLTWKGTDAQPIVAAKVTGADKTLAATVTVGTPKSDTEKDICKLTSPLVGEVTGALTLNATYTTSANSPLAVDMQSSAGNMGLLVNTLAERASFTLAGLALPDNLNGTRTINATADGANAGGLIGEAQEGATVALPTGIDVSALSVAGKNAAGGLIGKATKLTLAVGKDNSGKDASGKAIAIKPAYAVGSSSAGTYAGGLIGDASFADAFTINSGIFDFGKGVALSVSNTSAAPSAGGLFGVLDISNGDVTVNGGSYTSTLQNGKDDNKHGNYGGLVGKLWGKKNGDALHAFTVQGDTAVSFGVGSNGKLTYAGGLVGYLGEGGGSANVSAVVISDATVTCSTSGYASANGKYGGAVGVVDTNNVLEVRGLKVKTASGATIGGTNGGFAGVVGSSWLGIVKFSGITDLSDATFVENDHTAQLIYENFNSLIFAAGSGSDSGTAAGDTMKWQYKRPSTPVKIDDVYSYGQVIRLGNPLSENLISINKAHQWSFSSKLVKTGDAFALASIDDFAKLAITWQTSGHYSMVDGVTENNLNGLQSSTITVNGTIDLKGTGLTGFTQDRADGSQVFSGTLNGGGTINLAVGEPYGKRGEAVLDGNDTSNGNGKIYRHGRLGLFAAVNGATISNVTIAGSMKFDNGSAIDAGSLAGTIVGNLSLSGVTCKTNIACDDTFSNEVNIGGIAGSVSAASTVAFEGNSKAQATITKAQTLNGNMRIGGAIGYVGDYTSTFNVTRLEVGGKIKTGDCAGGKNAQVGGFIGCIVQGSNEKNVTITGLSFSEFAMTVGKNGDKLNGAGGLLGYSWGNAIVTIGGAAANTSDSTYALKTTNNTTVTANGSTEVGGLVYAASGHWIINDYAIDLSNATINADKATVLGLLIGRGGRTENSSTYGVETYSGLYLENKASWDTAYKVNDVAGNDVIINNTAIKSDDGDTSFDEWVGNGTKPAYGNEAGSKLIDGEWNVVVSLHTNDGANGGKLNMSGEPGSDNSYHNRSAFGSNHKTNAWTRYYYNLDKAYAEVGNNEKNSSASSWMDSAEYLLLWCAYLYAPPAIQTYIIPGNQEIFKGNNIGTSDSAGVEINLDGYSFYPTDPASGSTVTVNNATITFHYSDIKAEQEGNKKNSEATQHENMHCALIGTHTGSLKVKNVTLAGTVGSVVNDAGSSSGALVCRCIYGPINETNVAQLEIDGLTLDGLKVDGVNGNTSYAPLLINEMQTCVNLSAKNISTRSYANGATAATSLFGRLGVGKNSDQVTAKFEQISLPSQKNKTIFTHASLLESFDYGSTSTGSADYTFTKADADAGKVTYGSEIDAKDKEYSGKQLWYYDKETYATPNGLVTVDKKPADAKNPRFGDYLPYVYKGKATEDGVQYHEIKVNQRIPNLMTGCGTYGDPYAVTDATEMNAIANYINNSVALDGWEVTIAADQSRLCERRNKTKIDSARTDNEVVYVYKQANGADNKWEKKNGDATTDPSQTLSDETMHRYVQSAYYSIEPPEGNKITVDAASFGGFGNKANPFRGVIVGDLGKSTAAIEIENNKGELRGLIPYSYGSVVRNLNINYVNAQATITYSDKDEDGVPTAFFGGVIGCILGGDNIIDGVVVNNPNNGSTAYDFTVVSNPDVSNPDVSRSHLVPIGGYVGAIAGGGVIFRNTGTSWRGGTKNKKYKPIEEDAAKYDQYDNPYVGRVIDGYAFSEGCNVDNGDANYKINELINKGTPCVTTTGTDNKYIGTNAEAPVTTVENAQGLLVLSAIISSGAGAGAAHTNYADYGVFRGSKAYWGSDTQDPAIEGYLFGNKNYGKVRNASYDSVGKPAGVASDFEAAKNDDQKAPGKQGWHGPLDADNDVNSPYLVASYAANYQTSYVCASKSIGMSLEFKQGAPYDMTGYGTGYVGLNGRYYSNACDSNEATTDRDRITPHVATIDGNGATITVGTEDAAYGAVEYDDDDYKVSGVGGLFNTVMFTSTYVGPSVAANGDAQVRDLTFSNCNVALAYIDANGKTTSGQASNDLIGTGLLAGATANYDGGTCGVYRNVRMNNCTVSGAKSVGGLLGSSGRASRRTDNDMTYMVNFGSGTQAPAYLYDCSYTGLNVTGEKYVGGYVGTVASACGVWTTAAKGVNEKTVGENSTITATGTTPNVGGVLGYADLSDISVNTDIGTTTADRWSCTAVLSGVNVLATVKENTYDYMGAGGVAGCARGGTISMSNVRVDAGSGAKSVIIGGKDGTSSGIRNVGGLFGRVTTSPYKPGKYWFEDCSVKNVNFAGVNQRSGGLVGYYHSDVNIACNNITIEGATIEGEQSGGLLGMIHNGADVINVTNIKVSNTTFGGTSNGGIAGNGRGQFHLVNVLMDSKSYNAGKTQGVLLGEVDTGDGKYSLSAAGVDVKPGDGKTTSDLPPMVYTTNTAAVNKKTYIAFGDYNDRLDVPGKDTTLYGADDTATTAASPYVTTSPVSTLAVRASNGDTTDRYLFGDGVAIDTATTIQSQAGESVPGRYTYTNINGINDDGTYQNTSTYSANSPRPTFNTNNVTSGKKVANDFPVLMIPGNDTTTVEKYLNIVTNGGFSDARRLNGSAKHVTATAEVFSLADNGAFVKDAIASQTPTLKVLNNGTSSMVFRASTDWDNERGRFTLLTVTFSEAGQIYRVQVPIIVKRMLEIDFTATYSEGANFKAADYATKYDKHVLVSSGDTMTGYLTWTYGSARGEAVEYGWNTLLEAGGSMGPLNKSITFGATLPEGTQLTLVDTANNSREYHYTVGTGGATSVKLTEFVDASKNAYVEPWLSETVGVKAKEDKENGAWVKLTDDEVANKSQVELAKTAGAKVDGAYYRARTSSDTMGTFYTLSVAKEEPKSENFYLVVRTPAGSAGVNGYAATTVDTSLNEHINYLLRGKKAADGKAAEDGHQNTASTYSVASNYTHNLIDNNEGGIKQMGLHDVTYPLTMKVGDTVKFDPNQQYTSSDALYYQLDSSLVNYVNGSAAGAHGYPTGTQGTYSFCVTVGGKYYAPHASTVNGKTKWTWGEAIAEDHCAATTGVWTADGTDMKLTLADADHGAIDLSGIREIAKNHGSEFTITMEANLAMTEPACQAGIIASQNGGTDKYTKPNYRAHLSTHAETLSTSSNSAYIDGKAGYYRMDVGSSTIALEASKKSQLGINIDDLKSADGEIALVGTYDLSKLSGAEAMISNATKVTYTLSLQRRDKDGYVPVGDISKYITVFGSDKLGAGSLSGSSYVFTDTKAGDTFATRDGNSLAFKHAFRVKVNTDVETAGQTYANYRLVLTANMSDNGVIKDTPVNVSNLAGYANSDYVTYTLARINTKGIPHETKTN